jgi:phosphatidylglycerol:prolipoprotein diacylglycerol transferase
MTIFDISLFWIHIAPTYYGLMYVFWFVFWYVIVKKRWIIDKNKMDDLFFYIFLWVILWWRLWYILFYNFSSYISDSWSILRVWEWWMSFHGWVVWVVIAMLLFARKYKINFYKLSDQITAVLPIGLWLWRIWNYLNRELLGYAPYDWWLAVYRWGVWHFPSPLLEAVLEWAVLFIILNRIYRKKQFDGQIASLFLILYGVFRIFVEVFFRMPDSHIGYIWLNLSLWALLSIPMVVWWIYFYFRLKK